jgi:dTDP-4-dehydrorhamnose reductase
VLTMLRLMSDRDELNVVADQVGAPTWASTLARAIWAAVGKNNLNGIYHWSDAGVASWYDFAVSIQHRRRSWTCLNENLTLKKMKSDKRKRRCR